MQVKGLCVWQILGLCVAGPGFVRGRSRVWVWQVKGFGCGRSKVWAWQVPSATRGRSTCHVQRVSPATRGGLKSSLFFVFNLCLFLEGS